MGSLYLWGRSIQEIDGDVVIGRSMYGVVVIDGWLYSRFYGMLIVRSSIVHLTPILGCSYHLHSSHRFLST